MRWAAKSSANNSDATARNNGGSPSDPFFTRALDGNAKSADPVINARTVNAVWAASTQATA